MVPADIRLLESHDLRCEESALTGESLPVEKNATLRCTAGTVLGDRKNMLFSSSVLTAGNGTGGGRYWNEYRWEKLQEFPFTGVA